ncbi:uncharacterized protein PHALS_12952 [Plasmopara halstedii]|uniref:Uncharacterized protein n=1 Tax=Plasmopara halstedii TaxID=4781 RepID=A0A0P1AMS8_PLAHL|nr:uncharacterized protein PHALS_12952 [Plasmopara halstedii]CEG42698.1 hypothetical protein PHALS_12952 [Plasmopara halstedii]|eukprot:XP_024579067.1 hypothetical protein PHALS_12952 [Plasmopara halstedii]
MSSPPTIAPASTVNKTAILSLFSELDLALDKTVTGDSQANHSSSAAKSFLTSKNAEKQAEADFAALKALKREQQQQQKREQPLSALSQALDIFDQEVEEREAFMSRQTKRRLKGNKKARGGLLTPSRGRRQRHDKYKRV